VLSILLMEPNESAPYQEFRLTMMQATQGQWDGFYKSVPGKDSAFPLGLSVCFGEVSKWLGRSACGRVLRLRLESDGRFRDVTNADEADKLIGPGKTLATLAAAFSESESQSQLYAEASRGR
jgi:hypothetical protein